MSDGNICDITQKTVLNLDVAKAPYLFLYNMEDNPLTNSSGVIEGTKRFPDEIKTYDHIITLADYSKLIFFPDNAIVKIDNYDDGIIHKKTICGETGLMVSLANSRNIFSTYLHMIRLPADLEHHIKYSDNLKNGFEYRYDPKGHLPLD
ncbi:hypothetical protein ACFLTH_13690 [Bacteroidota bacterium]